MTDSYDMDTFGKPIQTTGTTPNHYRYGAAWGYITDPNGFLQLGARYLWPEVGRFVQQDPIRDEINLYAYAANIPNRMSDPAGLTHVEIGGSIGYGGKGVAGGLKVGCIPKPKSKAPCHGRRGLKNLVCRIWEKMKQCLHPYVGLGTAHGARMGVTAWSGSPSHGAWGGQSGTLGIPALAMIGPAASFGAGTDGSAGFSGGIGWGLGFFQGITYTF